MPAPVYTAENETPPQRIVIEISTAANWQAACRKSVEIASRSHGQDKLTIRLVERNMEIDFPNCRPRFSPRLVAELQNVAGVQRVNAI